MGLIKATEKFDYTKGYKFSTRSCSSALTTSAGNAPNVALTESSFPTFLSKTIRNTSAPLQSGMT